MPEHAPMSRSATRQPSRVASKAGPVSSPRTAESGLSGLARFLLAYRNQDGYVLAGLSQAGRRRLHRRIHHLVLEGSRDPRPAGMEAWHLNGVRTDHRLQNLE